MRKILFLDFDGVLHGQPVRSEHQLFEHAGLLADLLAGREDIDIVLSTTWVRVDGYDYAKSRLPESLQERIIGATYHSRIDEFWTNSTRFQQIMRYVRRHNIKEWLAIDDDDYGWKKEMRHRLVQSDPQGGILAVRDDLVAKLEVL